MEVPFSSLNNAEFSRLLNGKSIIPKKELKATPTIFEKLNLFTENENMACKHCSNEQIKKLKKDDQDITISLLHLNISSLPYHIDNLTYLLYDLDFKFKVTAITESRLTTTQDPKYSIEIPDYYIEHTSTKSEKAGALFYFSKNLNYINRQDFSINKDEMLESVFIDVLSKSNKNTIIGCIYKHRKMTVADFTQNFIQPLLDKLSFENKNMILLGDFNIDLLHYGDDNRTKIFSDHMYSSSLSPQITTPTRITPSSKTLIDNIFSNSADESPIRGNLSYSISDHLAQF